MTVVPQVHAAAVDPELRDAALKRLKRIEGQVRGLQRMVEEERYCADILMQIASAHEALRGVGKLLMRNLIYANVLTMDKYFPGLMRVLYADFVVTGDPKRTKVSVGSNPWARPHRPHDISRICERYGGGGHPVVGAVSLEPERLLDARRVAREIAGTLRGPATP